MNGHATVFCPADSNVRATYWNTTMWKYYWRGLRLVFFCWYFTVDLLFSEDKCTYSEWETWQFRPNCERVFWLVFRLTSFFSRKFSTGTSLADWGKNQRKKWKVLNYAKIGEFKQRRFWVIRINRKWTVCTLEPWLWTNVWVNRLHKSKDT